MVATMDPYTKRITEAGTSILDLAGKTMNEMRAMAERLDAGPMPAGLLEAAQRPGAYVAIDTETWRIAPGRVAPPLVCASFAWRDAEGRIGRALVDRATGCEAFRRLLRETDAIIMAHNAAFDWSVFWAAAVDLAPDIWQAFDHDRLRCTRIRELLLAVAQGRANRSYVNSSLAACVKRLLGEDVEGKSGADAWRLRYHELDGIPIAEWPEAASSYATLDAVYCLRVYEAQSVEAHDLCVEPAPTYHIPDEGPQTRAAWALRLTGIWGFRTDPIKVEQLATDYDRRLATFDAQLFKVGLVDETGKRNMDAIKALVVSTYDAHDLGEPPATEGGDVSTASDVLRTIPCQGDPCSGEYVCGEILHVLDRRQADALERSKYLKHLVRGTTEVINPRIGEVKATGRAGASNPPYQQFPRREGVRECIVPRRGYFFIGADYNSAELVTLAQVLLDVVGESQLAETLRAGKDPHLLTGSYILDITYEEALARYKAGDKAVKDARQLSKALNFGLPGGLGPDTFVDYAWSGWGLRVERERARELKELWLDLYPEVRSYFAIISDEINDGGGSFDLVQPRSGRLRGGVGYCDGCNSSFQGLAADATKLALYRVQRESWYGLPDASGMGSLYGCRPVLFMHDEIICEAPEPVSHAAAAAERLREVMVEAMRELVPDVPCDAEPWIARYWSKSAATVRDAGGNLQVWEG